MSEVRNPSKEECDCAGFCQEKTGCRGLPRRMAGHNHASSAEKAACPVCNPDKPVPELNEAYRLSVQRPETGHPMLCGCKECM